MPEAPPYRAPLLVEADPYLLAWERLRRARRARVFALVGGLPASVLLVASARRCWATERAPGLPSSGLSFSWLPK
jgi:hypothetical protein